MANETKKTVTNGTAAASVAEMRNGNFVIRREAIKDKRGNQYMTDDGRLYFKYQLNGTLRGREVRVDFSPKDKGGYVPLDLVFDVSPEAELDIIDEVTEFNGKKQHRTVYKAFTVDEGGTEWNVDKYGKKRDTHRRGQPRNGGVKDIQRSTRLWKTLRTGRTLYIAFNRKIPLQGVLLPARVLKGK